MLHNRVSSGRSLQTACPQAAVVHSSLRKNRVYRSNPATQQRRSRRSAKLHVRAFQVEAPTLPESRDSTVLNNAEKQKLHISWAGAGVFFFWQLGAMKFLAERYDMTKVSMVGASGGSLAAVLAACGVSADRVIQRAYEMSLEHNIWERPLGLIGIWGSLIEKWLDEMLPDNAHELCRGRVTVVVTTLPKWRQIGINDFVDKKDLINACMASSHVPFFLDFKLTRSWRGKQCVDGSFPDFFTGLNCDLLRFPQGGNAVVFDYFDDTLLKRKGRMDMLEVKDIDEIRLMMQLGYQYAAKLHEDGKFANYELAELLVQGEHGHMSEVLLPEHTRERQLYTSRANGLVIELEDEDMMGKLHQPSKPQQRQRRQGSPVMQTA